MKPSAVAREHQTFEAIPTSARAARRFVTETLRANDAAPKVVADYALVVSELVTNIIEHGDGGNVIIYLDLEDPEWWDVEVVGHSSTAPSNLLQPDTWAVAGSDEPSGRGLGIVRHLMDDITTDSNPGHISIRCRRRRIDG